MYLSRKPGTESISNLNTNFGTPHIAFLRLGGDNLGKIVETIHIRAPPEKVFAVLKDFENSPKWNVGWKEARWTSGKRNEVGATGHVVVETQSAGRIESDFEVTEYKENERTAFRSTAGNATVFGSSTLTPSRGGTEVRSELNYELPYSILGKIIDRLKVSREARKNAKQTLLNLKKMLEK